MSSSREAADDEGDGEADAEHDREQADGGADGCHWARGDAGKRYDCEVHKGVDGDAVEQAKHYGALDEEKPFTTREIKNHCPNSVDQKVQRQSNNRGFGAALGRRWSK